MNHPMIIWCAISGVLLCAFLLRIVKRYYYECRHSDQKTRHILQLGKDKDIFYLPGDVDEDDDF